jgi:hypothetical protein
MQAGKSYTGAWLHTLTSEELCGFQNAWGTFAKAAQALNPIQAPTTKSLHLATM